MAENDPAGKVSGGPVGGGVVVRDEPELSVQEIKRRVQRVHDLLQSVMVVDTHYGVIPGTTQAGAKGKPTLLKAGAEKLCVMFRLAPSFRHDIEKDGEHRGITSECRLTHIPTGLVMATAGGSCTTRETKYAFRQATRKCPTCGTGAIIKDKFAKGEFEGGFYCFPKKGGCGAKFQANDQAIIGQEEGRADNPNLADTYNTVLKMADKRALVAATLLATGCSDIFTQDIEDMVDDPPVDVTPKPEPVQSRSVQRREAAMSGENSPEFAPKPIQLGGAGMKLNPVVESGDVMNGPGQRPFVNPAGEKFNTPHDVRDSPGYTLVAGKLADAAKLGMLGLKRCWQANQKIWKEEYTPELFEAIEALKEDWKIKLEEAKE